MDNKGSQETPLQPPEPVSEERPKPDEAPLTEQQNLLLQKMIRQGMDKDTSLKAIRLAQLKQKEIVLGFYKDMQNEEKPAPKPQSELEKASLPFRQEGQRFPVNPKPVPEQQPQDLGVQAKPEPQPQNVEPKVEQNVRKPQEPEEAPLTEQQNLLLQQMIAMGLNKDISLKALKLTGFQDVDTSLTLYFEIQSNPNAYPD